MKFEQFDDIISREVVEKPLLEDEFCGNEMEHYELHKDRIYSTLRLIQNTANGKKVLDIGCEARLRCNRIKNCRIRYKKRGINLIALIFNSVTLLKLC